MRELTNLFTAIAKVKAEGCDKCFSGTIVILEPPTKVEHISDLLDSRIKGNRPCPTCAKLREIAEWHWHEQEGISGPCMHCGKPYNPQCATYYKWNKPFTVQSIRAAMEVLGEDDKFMGYLFNRDATRGILICNTFTMPEGIADTLRSDPLMVEAAKAYLTQRLEELR